MSGTPTPSASSLARMTGTASAAASLLTVMRTSSEPAWASCATWMAVPSASAVSVFVIDCTTTGCADPTGTPPTTTVARRAPAGGCSSAAHGRACPPGSARGVHDGRRDRRRGASRRACGRMSGSSRTSRRRRSWRLSCARRWGAEASVFRAPLPYLAALREATPPMAVVLDWRLEHELSAALFLATRHRYPHLPVIYWTGSPASALAVDDRRRRAHGPRRQGRRRLAVRARPGVGARGGVRSPGLPALGAPEHEDGVHPAETERGRHGGVDARGRCDRGAPGARSPGRAPRGCTFPAAFRARWPAP